MILLGFGFECLFMSAFRIFCHLGFYFNFFNFLFYGYGNVLFIDL
jgi:hypothetical protein